MKLQWLPLENDQQYLDIIMDDGETFPGKFGIWHTRGEDGDLTGSATICHASDGADACNGREMDIANARALAAEMSCAACRAVQERE